MTAESIANTRIALIALTYATAGFMTMLFLGTVAVDGLHVVDTLLVAVFAVLMTLVAQSFWTATFGFCSLIKQRLVPQRPSTRQLASTQNFKQNGFRTAILMPVYNECPADVFANVEAMRRSLYWEGVNDGFDFFVLSDTTDPEVWIQEERRWAECQQNAAGIRVYYRHREKNVERKSGNIADFCRRWGSSYRYMLVLDADSLMSGSTIVEMVRRAEADPKIGILQIPPQPVGCESLFARLQQFSAATYGAPFLRGFNLWAGDDGNYWGHNAIICTQAFIAHCGLPKLPGKAPLGGEILSHDFVEAALMRRAGYKVCVADDLGGSYEECPTGIQEYAQRDNRWCQGNLQHARLLSADGFTVPSRLHMLMGVMSYAASPLWFAFILGGMLVAAWSRGEETSHAVAVALFAVSMAMLLLPKFYGVVVACANQSRRKRQGGVLAIVASAVLETFVSVLLAPIMMLYHSRFVVTILAGRKVGWATASRGDRAITWSEAFRSVWWATAVGLVLTAATWFAVPGLLPWLSPILAGLLLAIPLTYVASHPKVGLLARRMGLLLVCEETCPPPVIENRDQIRSRMAAAESDLPTLLHHPKLLRIHTSILEATGTNRPLPQSDRRDLVWRLSQHEQLSNQDRFRLQSDAQLLRDLHLTLRSGTPLESLLESLSV